MKNISQDTADMNHLKTERDISQKICNMQKGKEKRMNKEHIFHGHIKRVFAVLLVFAFVLTSLMLPLGGGKAAYAAEGEIKLMLDSRTDELNDSLEISVMLTEMPESGISGLEFKINYPEEFVLKDDGGKTGVIGEKFTGMEGTNPFYVAFGNMNQATGGIYNDTGEIARFSFSLKDNCELTAGASYNFNISSANAVVFEMKESDYGSVAKSRQLNVDFSEAVSKYEPIKSDITGMNNGSITVSKPDKGIAKIKTETIRKAIEDAQEDIILDMSSSSTADSKEKIIISREGAQAVSDAEKNLIIKTDAGQLEFDKKAAAALKETAEETAITISVEKKTDKDSAGKNVSNTMNLSISAMSGDNYIKSFNGGSVKVNADIPENMRNKELKCMFYDIEKKLYKMIENGTVTDNGKVYSFNTDHFSEYMIGAQETLESYIADNELKEGVKISGKVQSYNPKNETVFVLKQNGSEKARTEISAEAGSGQKIQAFSFEAVPEGTYDLVVTKAGHLTYTIKDVIVGDDDIDLTAMTGKAYKTITLLAGDVNGDGRIFANDFTSIRNNLMKTGEGITNPLADVNGGGKVFANDFVPVRVNLMKTNVNCTYNFEEK